MKTIKRTISSLLVIFLLASSVLFLTPAKTANAATLAQAQAWMDKVVKAGTRIDTGSSAGQGQCVALFNEYLKTVLGVNWQTYYPKTKIDYAYQIYDQTTPPGFTKISGAGNYKAGDIIVFKPNIKYNGYTITGSAGHVAVIYSVSGSNVTVVHQHWDNNNVPHKTTMGAGMKSAVKGVIRPTFGDPIKVPDHATSANIVDGTYMLKNVGSGYAMNYAYGVSGNPVWLAKYGDENKNEQHFKFTHVESGKYKIETCYSLGSVVNCESSGSVSAGTKITIRTNSNNDTQRFYVTPVGSGKYILQSASNPNLVIGAPSSELHAKLELQSYTATNNQYWTFSSDPSIPTYTITAANVSNGKVSFSKTSAKAGEEITITATPNTGYTLDTIKVNGTAITGKTFTMPGKNTTVEVTFKKAVYKVTVSATSNGSASVSKTSANYGDEITVTTNPAGGYELNWIKYNDNTVSGNKFTMPASDVTVTVNFRRKDAPVLGSTVTVGNFIYKVTDAASDGTGTVTLTGVATKSESVSIPATIDINGYKYIVNRIGPNAFKNDKTLKTLYISANIRFIDNCAFYGCSSLVKVSGGAKLEIIGQSAFISCTKLKTFVITSTVLKKIGPTAFYGDKALKTLTIKSTVKLTKAGVKKSLKGSKVKTVKVKKSKVKKYKKFFTKKNAGRKVKVKK